MSKAFYKQVVLYLLCLYNIYLYLPDTLDLFHIDFYPSDFDVLLYFDAAMMLIGGVVLGRMLIKQGGGFNKYVGVLMIVMNVVLMPVFIWRAIP